jgi:hypothetical protein
MLSTIVIGVFMTKNFSIEILFEDIWYVSVYMIQAFAYMCIGLFISIIVKNTALSILFFFLYFFPVEPIIRAVIPDVVSNLFPMKVISNLTPMPDFIDMNGQAQFYTSVNGQVMNSQPIYVSDEYPMYVNILMAILYSVILIFSSYLILKKRNL